MRSLQEVGESISPFCQGQEATDDALHLIVKLPIVNLQPPFLISPIENYNLNGSKRGSPRSIRFLE